MQLNQPFAWLLLLSSVVPLHMIAIIWRKRNVPGARSVLVFLAAMTVWSLGYAFELFNTRLEVLLFMAKLQWIGVTIVPVAYALFAFQYTHRREWLAVSNIILLFVEPVVMLLVVFTNELHGFLYERASVGMVDGFAMLQTVRGPAFWIHVAYSYALLFAGTALILAAMFRERNWARQQSGWVLVGVLAPWIGNLFYMLRLTNIDLTPLGFTVSGVALAISVNHFQLFSIIPIARGQLLDILKDGVLVTNDRNEILDANPAACSLFSHVNGSLVGKKLETVFTPWPELLAGYAVDEERSGEVNLGNSVVPHWFTVSVTPLYRQPTQGWRKPSRVQKELFGHLMVFQDIQERKMSEEAIIEARDQALQASLFKGQLIANVSHDLRTPLNAIMGYAEMLLEGTYGPVPQEQGEALRQMLLSAQQMNLFVADLLDQALIEKGRLALYPIDFKPEELLQGVRSLIGQAAERKGLQLRIIAEPDLPAHLNGDVKRLQQIIMNLIQNAIKFTKDGWVSVRLYRASPTTWGIEVADTGSGIPQEARAYIFEPFRQAEQAVGQPGGAGLGLAIVRHLVLMMGGHVELESHLGLGSVFRVILPLTKF